MTFWLLACASADVTTFARDRALAICAWHARCETLPSAGFEDASACEETLLEAADEMARRDQLICDVLVEADAEACLAVWSTAACGVPLDLTPCDNACQ